MPELLLELFCEEIPAGLQEKAGDDLRRMITDGCVNAGLTYEGAKPFFTPRRVTLSVHGLTARSADVREERKGPRIDAPEKAIAGFLRGAGLASIEDAEVRNDPKKGDFYVAIIDKPGRTAEDILAELIPDVIRSFPWPKSMRWGALSAPAGTPWSDPEAKGTSSLRWVRPLQSILCTFGPETEDPVVIPFSAGGIESSDVTFGHRFMSNGEPIRVRRLSDYMPSLERAKVILDSDRRQAIIETEANNLAFAQGLEVVDDKPLVKEVAGLVEWPVVLMGTFDPTFLEIPDEVVRLTIRINQKCFVVRDPMRDGLGNRFLLTANLEATDGGREIIAGNERVIAARLSDARFFYEQDKAVPLEEWGDKLSSVTFHEELGSQAERVARIASLARKLAPFVSADPANAERAARLAKADLTTAMVGEFPELQGVMGRYYALDQGETAVIADAIRDHYKPQGQGERAPTEAVSIAVALADKLDMLVCFWAIDQKPTGSKDPYALRRAALGVIRIILENEIRLNLLEILEDHAQMVVAATASTQPEAPLNTSDAVLAVAPNGKWTGEAIDLLEFFADRLKVHLRDEGVRYDLIDSVFALEGQDDLVAIVRRVDALSRFLSTQQGENLLAGYRRATNILKAEEKKDGAGAFEDNPDRTMAERGSVQERQLFGALESSELDSGTYLNLEDFEGAMEALALLQSPVDQFFDQVTVNADDPALRINRLRLLARIRRAMHRIADFAKVSGG